MTDPIHDYDPAQALEGREAIAVFIADALETGDAAYIANAMDVVARARGMIDLDDLHVEIPAKALAALAEILDQIAKGNTVDIQGIPALLATREAAALLNLPHPRLLQLLDDGAIASRIINGRRRVQVADLVAYRQAQAEASSAAMDELTRESERLNLGY